MRYGYNPFFEYETFKRAYIPFTVYCVNCKRKIRPYSSIKGSVLRVLTGDLSKCPHCGEEFAQIQVPGRPLVMKAWQTLNDDGFVLPDFIIVCQYEKRVGSVPCARAFPEDNKTINIDIEALLIDKCFCEYEDEEVIENKTETKKEKQNIDEFEDEGINDISWMIDEDEDEFYDHEDFD